MCSSGSDDVSREMRQQQIQREGMLKTGMADINKAYAGFDDPFYKQRQQDYINFAAPEFGRQYQQTRGSMLYGLANRRMLGSSNAQDLANQLARERNLQQQNIADTGRAQANALRQQVEQNRSALVGQLVSTGDPAETTQAALRSAASFAAPSTFQPLGPLFQNFANTYLASQYANAYQPLLSYYAQYTRPVSDTGGGAFAPPASTSVR
jgi:hypothetical protein